MDIDCTWLEANFFKQQLNDKQKELVYSKFEAVQYAKGDTILLQGEQSHTVFIMHSGCAYIDCDSNGEHVRVGSVKAGDLVGEMSFISESTASATVTAAEDCIVYKLSRQAFAQMLELDKGLMNLTFTTLLKHTSEVVRNMNAEKASMQHYMSGNHF